MSARTSNPSGTNANANKSSPANNTNALGKMGFVRPVHRAIYKLLKRAASARHCFRRLLPLQIRAEVPELVLQNARILRLDFCSDIQIFDAASTTSSISSNAPRRIRVHRETTLSRCRATAAKRRIERFRKTDKFKFLAPTLPVGNICYLSYGLAVSSDEKLHKGEFVTEDVTQDFKDKTHPKPWVEGKLLNKWLPLGHRWLEWGTTRAPSHFRRITFEELCEVPEKILILRVAGNDLEVVTMITALHESHIYHRCSWHFLDVELREEIGALSRRSRAP